MHSDRKYRFKNYRGERNFLLALRRLCTFERFSWWYIFHSTAVGYEIGTTLILLCSICNSWANGSSRARYFSSFGSRGIARFQQVILDPRIKGEVQKCTGKSPETINAMFEACSSSVKEECNMVVHNPVA